MKAIYLSKISVLTGLALAISATVATVPASAGGLLGGVTGGATGAVGGALGIGGGGLPVGGGLTGAGSGVVGATLGGGGLQPGFGSGVANRVTNAATSSSGRAWGTFDDAKGALHGKAAAAKDSIGAVAAKKLPTGALTPGQASAKATGLKSMTDGFVLSRNFDLPTKSAAPAHAQASGKASASGSASAQRVRVAGGGSAQAEAGK